MTEFNLEPLFVMVSITKQRSLITKVANFVVAVFATTAFNMAAYYYSTAITIVIINVC